MLIQGNQAEQTIPDGGVEEQQAAMAVNAIGEKQIAEAISTLKKYKEGKSNLEERIIQNEQWYRLRHWEVMRSKYSSGDNAAKGRPEPSSAWLFNALANKHADAMDNFPDPSILPREKNDVQDAKSLSSVIPVVLERNDFEETYSDAWWYKLKMGTVPYGVFWDPSLENGLGDISIKKLDILNLFWEPGITDLQKSRNLFIVDLVDNDILKAEYPDKNIESSKVIDASKYVYDDTVDVTDKSLVVDWYYKKRLGTKTVLHYVKFVGNTLLYASENDPEMQEGWYIDGRYPVEFDVLFPEEGTCFGFGYIDISKDPQMYIDKLNQIIIENALRAGKKRWFVKDQAAFNLDQFADWSKDFVEVTGNLDDSNLREIETSQLDGTVINLLTYKIEELKETTGNRDVNQGSTGGGVTAAAAIAALQEAGNKLSRDMIKGGYRTFAKLNYMCIERIRQFYSTERTFRIEGTGGGYDFLPYSNANIAPQEVPPAAEGLDPGVRMPIFDIKVKPQRANPFSRMAHNELAKELYAGGMFNPEMADQALIALDMMDFEGKEAVVDKLNTNRTLLAMLQEMQAVVAGMMGLQTGPPQGGQSPPAAAMQGGPGVNGGYTEAGRNATTSYGERLAENAKVKV